MSPWHPRFLFVESHSGKPTNPHGPNRQKMSIVINHTWRNHERQTLMPVFIQVKICAENNAVRRTCDFLCLAPAGER